jgi:hypothetical protein
MGETTVRSDGEAVVEGTELMAATEPAGEGPRRPAGTEAELVRRQQLGRRKAQIARRALAAHRR